MFSKNATKIDVILTVALTLCSKSQIDGKDFFNFCGLLRKHKLYTTVLIKMDFRTEKKHLLPVDPSPRSSTIEVMLSHSGQSTQRGTEQLPKHHTHW